jgi:hypothetical protein
MEIELIFIGIALLAVGFYSGWTTASRFHLSMISEILREAGIGVQKLTEIMENLRTQLPEDHPDALPVLKIRIEKMEDQYYAYNVQNNEFVGQASSEKLIFEDILKANPNQNLIVLNKIEEMK